MTMNNNEAAKRIDPTSIPHELTRRYHKSGPRYTSYPTAPQFQAQFDESLILHHWKESNRPPRSNLSIYLHIPFCKSRCLYCGCHTETGRSQQTIQQYLKALLAEMDRLSGVFDSNREVEQLALGGGTPTSLSPELMTSLVEGLKARFIFPETGERSIEIDPRSVDNEYMDNLMVLGFNRFSFGVQDLNPDVQKMIGRLLPEEKLLKLLGRIRDAGSNAINLDLIYGLPGQSLSSFSHTIEKVIQISPSRIALFGYAHVPWIKPHQKKLEAYTLPSPEKRMKLFGMAYNMLLDSGYEHVGMDHFALPEDELVRALNNKTLTRNFMGYTTRRGLDLIALGASAISSVGPTYAQNEKDIDDYMKRSSSGCWIKGLILNDEDLIRREIILELFCNFFLDITDIERKYGINFNDHFKEELKALRTFDDDGLVELDSGRSITVTKLGRFFIRNICMNFDQYLKKDEGKVRYSKTI